MLCEPMTCVTFSATLGSSSRAICIFAICAVAFGQIFSANTKYFVSVDWMDWKTDIYKKIMIIYLLFHII